MCLAAKGARASPQRKILGVKRTEMAKIRALKVASVSSTLTEVTVGPTNQYMPMAPAQNLRCSQRLEESECPELGLVDFMGLRRHELSAIPVLIR